MSLQEDGKSDPQGELVLLLLLQLLFFIFIMIIFHPTQHTGIKVRADDGLSAVDYLAKTSSNYIKHKSVIFGKLIKNLQDVGYVPYHTLFAAPYDWRLPPSEINNRRVVVVVVVVVVGVVVAVVDGGMLTIIASPQQLYYNTQQLKKVKLYKVS